MTSDFLNKTLTEIKSGYSYNDENCKYSCNNCGKEFETGEIFMFDNRYFEASKAIKLHIEKEHKSMFEMLTSYDKKYTGLTENQKELLAMINKGLSDNEIAKKLCVAPSTIRHQRFVLGKKPNKQSFIWQFMN